KAGTPTGKGRTIAAMAAHLHNVRLMWLAAADKNAKLPAKLDGEKVSIDDAQASLTKSASAICELLEKGLSDPAGHVPNFKPDVVAFVGYLIAHDAHHRGQMAMLARQVGHPVASKASFGLWEWGTLAKEGGIG
ncbi:MAG TPA: DinB family protein, partial [Candidatus Acidoferrum sp.]|nr:DinB family protein [Candidatus Acidoferrum sp.]